MKRTWVNYGHPRNWCDAVQGEGEAFLKIDADHILGALSQIVERASTNRCYSR